MAKNNGGGNGSKNTRTSAEQDAIRRAAKARQHANAQARAHGKGAGSRSSSNLQRNYREDLLNRLSNERRLQAVTARKVLAHMADTAPLHAAGSHTAIMANEAYQAALQMIEAFENTNPVLSDTSNRIVKHSLDIVCEQFRDELVRFGGKQFADVIIKEVRNAVLGIKQRAPRLLDAA